jgi:hypothetical protein
MMRSWRNVQIMGITDRRYALCDTQKGLYQCYKGFKALRIAVMPDWATRSCQSLDGSSFRVYSNMSLRRRWPCHLEPIEVKGTSEAWPTHGRRFADIYLTTYHGYGCKLLANIFLAKIESWL